MTFSLRWPADSGKNGRIFAASSKPVANHEATNLFGTGFCGDLIDHGYRDSRVGIV